MLDHYVVCILVPDTYGVLLLALLTTQNFDRKISFLLFDEALFT